MAKLSEQILVIWEDLEVPISKTYWLFLKSHLDIPGTSEWRDRFSIILQTRKIDFALRSVYAYWQHVLTRNNWLYKSLLGIYFTFRWIPSYNYFIILSSFHYFIDNIHRYVKAEKLIQIEWCFRKNKTPIYFVIQRYVYLPSVSRPLHINSTFVTETYFIYICIK